MRFKEGENVHVIVGNELLSGWYNGKEFGTGNSLVKVSKDKIIATKDCFIAKEKEPELVVVPRFAADWIKHCKQREYDLACLLDYEDSDMSAEMYEWLISSADNQELLARAWLDGYEVEKEPLYYVRLPLSTWNDDAAELEVINMYVLLNVQSDETSITGSIINENKEWRTKLTEAEIKGIPGGEIYWQFAVLVEEAEA
ncbi:DUF1642 domain-containing protein [Listeria monocytogenes]